MSAWPRAPGAPALPAALEAEGTWEAFERRFATAPRAVDGALIVQPVRRSRSAVRGVMNVEAVRMFGHIQARRRWVLRFCWGNYV